MRRSPPPPPPPGGLAQLRQQLKRALAQTEDRDLRGGLGHALKAIERHEQRATGDR